MKTKIMKVALLGALVLPLVGCDNGTPNCDSSEAKDLVVDITKDELRDQKMGSLIDQIKIKVESVRTREHDAKRDTYSCAADLSFEGQGGKNSIPITYTIESTDDGKQFYVNVFGL
ncbi:MAG TPA: hypothetical protein DEV59_01395 [Proteus sp.]|uniref:Lipoprotein n=1 Tax=Proteus hauseri ATCC 700826 TaxID=1354271 RepID=A0AAJ3HR59_PROHU|nr:hypothetical protein [Proteus hauseri]OAT45463.1 hypothetical protein M997_3012 [Proteus hauseri ATCC 700826]HCH49353.1 hypothetical protein [Proteus sp. (in: enterobacteria)]